MVAHSLPFLEMFQTPMSSVTLVVLKYGSPYASKHSVGGVKNLDIGLGLYAPPTSIYAIVFARISRAPLAEA